MPRSGGGIYAKPFPDVVAGTTIASAVHNGIVADVETDLNAARPVIAGGTGAVNAFGARTNLQVERAMQTVTNFDSHVWETGSFFAAIGATAGPPTPAGGTTTENFFGIVYGDAVNMFVEARSMTTGLNYVRRKTGTWSNWALDGGDKLSNTGGAITGNLTITGTLGVTGTTTLGTLVAGTTTLGATTSGAHTVNGALNAGANTLTVGAINASGLATVTGLTTNGNITATGRSLSIGTITATGTITAPTFSGALTGTASGNVPTGGGTITGALTVNGGLNAGGGLTATVIEGPTYIDMKYGGSVNDYDARLIVDTSRNLGIHPVGGTLTVTGQVTASQFNGPLNGHATSAGSVSSFSGDSLWVNNINTQSGGQISFNTQVGVNGGVLAHGYRQRQGISGGYTGNPAYVWFNICIANSGAAFEFWAQDTNYGAIYMASDYRTKKDVRPLPSMWDRVKALNPISYTTAAYNGIKADDDERWGMIAHELQDTLVPTAANGHKDQENVVQSPNPMTVIAALTKALQEAMERIEVLESIAQPT